MTWLSGAEIMGRARSTTGALSTPVVLSGGPGVVFTTSMSLDGSGTALVAWIGGTGGSDARVRARTRSATGHLSPIVTLSTAGGFTENVSSAMGAANGTGVVAWVRDGDSGGAVVQSRRLVGGTWQAITNLTPASITPANMVMATSADAGRTTFVFTSFEDDGLTQRLRAREQRANGTLGPLSIVTAENGNGGGVARLAVNASGQAAASWFARIDPNGLDLVWVATNFLL